MSTVRVFYINSTENGIAEPVEVPADMTVNRFLADRVPGFSEEKFKVRVTRNGEVVTVTAGTTFQNGDRISLVPAKIAGA